MICYKKIMNCFVTAGLIIGINIRRMNIYKSFRAELIRKDVVIQNNGYNNIKLLYENNIKEIEKGKKYREKLEMIKKEEELKDFKALDRGYDGGYKTININCIVSYYTNENSRMEGGQKDIKGNPLLGYKIKICAAPKNIPYGSFVEMDNLETYKVVDRGSAIKWINEDTMKIDVFVPNATQKQLNSLGIKKHKAKVYLNIKN